MKYYILFLFTLSTVFTKAQSFKSGDVDLNLGVGIGNTFIGSAFTTTLPALSISVDFAVADAISIGGYVGYTKAEWEYSGIEFCNSGNGVGNTMYTFTDTYTWSYTILGVRGAYHFTSLTEGDKTDVYAGLMLAGNIASSTFSSVMDPFCDKHTVVFLGDDYGGFLMSIFVGARHRLNEHVGIFGELGYGVTVLNVGLHYKL